MRLLSNFVFDSVFALIYLALEFIVLAPVIARSVLFSFNYTVCVC